MKRADIIKQAQQRLITAQQAADEEQLRSEIAFALAEKMINNGLFIVQGEDGSLIIATIKHTQTIH